MKTIDCNLQTENAQKFNKKIADLIQSKVGSQFLFSNISYEDKKTIGLFQSADTDHIFGFESDKINNPARIKSALKSYKPENFDDLVLLYALYKPANYPDFQRTILQAKENQTFALFKDVLKKSDDVPLWREQVFAIMQKATGCSLACADVLRRNMGKKNAKVLAKDKKQFVEAATKNGYSEQNAGELFENLIPFASYTESISADVSAVKISWQSAYFKTHYPEEFGEIIRLSGQARQ